MKSSLRFIVCTFALAMATASIASAQSGSPTAETDQTNSVLAGNFVLKAGLSQPLLLNGANLALAYKTNRWVFEYSHGMWLQYARVGRTDTERNQNIDLYSPWTTGLSIGYRLPWRFDVRVELKAHRYRATPPGNESFAYTTFSIGPAVNYHQPVYKGIGFDLTIRFWPNVANTLADDQRAFIDRDGKRQVHEAHDLGVFPNASLTYTF